MNKKVEQYKEYGSLDDNEYEPVSEHDYQAVRKNLKKQYKETQMRFELQLFHDRQRWSEDDPLSKWFLATRERTAIFHMFNLTSQYPQGLSVGMVSRFLNIARSTTSRLLTEAHTLKFIYRNKKEGLQRFYLPSQHLLDNGDFYSEYYIDQILSIETWPDRMGFFELKRVEQTTRRKLRHGDVVKNYKQVIVNAGGK